MTQSLVLTVCTIAQLPQAFTLGASLRQHQPNALFVIGLADDPARLPADFRSPYALLPAADCLPDGVSVSDLSARYTPTEFTAAVKPSVVRAALARFPDAHYVVYADPQSYFYASPGGLIDALAADNVLLTPHLTAPPTDNGWPDEKHFQNVGLYSAGLLVFRRSAETERMLAWWQDRVTTRAEIDFCAGRCTDQLWLMHVPVFFAGVRVLTDPTWHAALWNLPTHQLTEQNGAWHVANAGPLRSVNFTGLHNPNEGFFAHQTRLRLAQRPDVVALLTHYRQALAAQPSTTLASTQPAYGERPEPIILRGWRRSAARSLRAVRQWVDTVPLPVLR